LKVLSKPRLLALAVAMATLAALPVLGLAAPTTRAANPYPGNPPKFALMKGDTVIQKGLQSSTCWSYWSKTRDHWTGYCADAPYAFPRHAAPVPAGSNLHVRLYKPQRPDRVQLGYFPAVNDEVAPGPGAEPIGKRQPLHPALKRVRDDGKTVAWDLSFYVKEPHSHYYIDAWVAWEPVPGTRISSGDVSWAFHVKTR
jgi:hypothetical protein